MTAFDAFEAEIDALGQSDEPAAAERLLALGEEIVVEWIRAKGETPSRDEKEGFRLLALHRQGCKGTPSFNACRETCRELVYHYNLIIGDPAHPDTEKRLRMAAMVARHLCLFIGGKMRVEQLGEFCCSSRPIRANEA